MIMNNHLFKTLFWSLLLLLIATGSPNLAQTQAGADVVMVLPFENTSNKP